MTIMGMIIMEVAVIVVRVTAVTAKVVIVEIVKQVEMVEQVITVITTEEHVGTLLTVHVNLAIAVEIYIKKYVNHGLSTDNAKTADANWHIQKNAECMMTKEYVIEPIAGMYTQRT